MTKLRDTANIRDTRDIDPPCHYYILVSAYFLRDTGLRDTAKPVSRKNDGVTVRTT